MFTTCCVTHLFHLVYAGLPLDSLNGPPASSMEGLMEEQLCSAMYLLRLVKSLYKNGRLKVKVHTLEINAFKRGCCTHGTHKAIHPKITAAHFL